MVYQSDAPPHPNSAHGEWIRAILINPLHIRTDENDFMEAEPASSSDDQIGTPSWQFRDNWIKRLEEKPCPTKPPNGLQPPRKTIKSTIVYAEPPTSR